MSQLLLAQLPYVVAIVALFAVYGTLVRRGAIAGKRILLVGALVSVVAVAIWSVGTLSLLPPRSRFSSAALVGPLMMAFCAAYCVFVAYRSQRRETLATFTVDETTVNIVTAPPTLLPPADALLLPTTTSLRLFGAIGGAVGFAAGKSVREEVAKSAPVTVGRVLATGGGNLHVPRIHHAAICKPTQNMDAASVSRGMEAAAGQARKAGATHIIVPVAPLRGLTLEQTVSALFAGVWRQHRAFREINFVVFEARDGAATQAVVRREVDAAIATPPSENLPDTNIIKTNPKRVKVASAKAK